MRIPENGLRARHLYHLRDPMTGAVGRVQPLQGQHAGAWAPSNTLPHEIDPPL